MGELIFKNYKEKQNYYKELYNNRGTTLHVSKVMNAKGKVVQMGSSYTSDKGDIRRIKRQAKLDRKNK